MNWKKLTLTAAITIGIISSMGSYWYLSAGPPVMTLSGVVETQEVRLGSKIGGRISKVAVREGTIVDAGTPLVFLDAPELEARRAQAQASLDAAQAMLDKARNGPRAEEKAAARATADVARAKLKRLQAGYRDEEVAMALAEWKATQHDLDRAQKEWDRESRLQKTGASSAAQIDTALAGYSRLQEQTKLLHARWQMLTNGSRSEDKAEAAAELARAEAQAELLNQGTRAEEIAEASAKVAEIYARIRELDAQLQEAIIVAPDRALIETVAVRRGDTAAPNQPLVRVLLAEDLWVKAYVPELQLGQILLGQEVQVRVDSFPHRTFRGVVSHIASTSEFTPRNVQTVDERSHQVFAFKVRMLESENVFKSGMAADVLLPLNPQPK